MVQETHLERKLRQLGLSADAAAAVKKLHFKLYFPRPPYTNLQYRAARAKDGFNFVGLVLGHQGRTIQQIQQTTGARVEIHSKQGNLNGDHPIATDPTLHAKIIASNEESLEEATRFVARLLEPVNAEHEEFDVIPGGSAVLLAVSKHHAESKRQAKQQRKAIQRAEQELNRAFTHGRSHSIDSGNSLISETVHMSTSSLTADTEADIASIAESESPFAHPLPDHHSSADGGPAWVSPLGVQPSQARRAAHASDVPGPHDPIVLPARTASKTWSDQCSPAWPLSSSFSAPSDGSIQVEAAEPRGSSVEGKTPEMRDINPHDWLAAAQGQQSPAGPSWLHCAPFPGALPRQPSLY